MRSIEDMLFESEKDSFKTAAEVAKQHRTQLVFWEDGHLVKRSPTPQDLMGTSVKNIKDPNSRTD